MTVQDPAHDRPRILVVDDSSINRQILAGVLGKEHTVEVAEDGPAALAKAEAAPPDLVLLDVMMPGMDGYEVCRRLRAAPATKDVPVIFVTAVGEETEEVRGFELGAVDYMTKPVRPAVVRARVRTHLQLRKARETLASLPKKLSRFIPVQLYESLLAGRHEAALRTHRRKLTVFFSDIVGFTATTEAMDPEDFTSMLNGYLDTMAAIVLRHGGTLDKFIGDAVMVFFGDPESRGARGDALACAAMALEMRDAIASLNDRWRREGLPRELRVRMGMATGFCTVGNFGCPERMEYTIFGSPVNLASRLEHAARPGQILVAHGTSQLVEDQVLCEPAPLPPLKGFPDGMTAHALVEFHARLAHAGNLERETQGFRLRLHPARVPDQDRADVVAALRAALDLLGPANGTS